MDFSWNKYDICQHLMTRIIFLGLGFWPYFFPIDLSALLNGFEWNRCNEGINFPLEY